MCFILHKSYSKWEAMWAKQFIPRGKGSNITGEIAGMLVETLHFATTKSPECSTTAASVWLDNELKKVMTLLEVKDRKLIAEQGISRYWIIEDMENFFQDIKIKDAMGQLKGKKPRTTDFTTMYTSLKQVDIVNNVERQKLRKHLISMLGAQIGITSRTLPQKPRL